MDVQNVQDLPVQEEEKSWVRPRSRHRWAKELLPDKDFQEREASVLILVFVIFVC